MVQRMLRNFGCHLTGNPPWERAHAPSHGIHSPLAAPPLPACHPITPTGCCYWNYQWRWLPYFLFQILSRLTERQTCTVSHTYCRTKRVDEWFDTPSESFSVEMTAINYTGDGCWGLKECHPPSPPTTVGSNSDTHLFTPQKMQLQLTLGVARITWDTGQVLSGNVVSSPTIFL